MSKNNENQNFKFIDKEIKTDIYFTNYIKKKICRDLFEILFLTFCAISKHIKRKNLGTQIYFLIDQRPWMNEIDTYASTYNIKLIKSKNYTNLNLKEKFIKHF